jgi:hypothetical protein
MKDINPAKAAIYDAAIAALPNTRESVKTILDVSGNSDYLVIVDHPHEDSITMATHMSINGMRNAACTLISSLSKDADFPPLPPELRALGVREETARLIVVSTTILGALGLTADNVEVIAGLLKRKAEFDAARGPSSIEV